jgi:hypothetical protein
MDEFDDRLLVERVARRTTVEDPPHKVFRPWHRPRKQWIRRYQWHDGLLEVVRDTHFPDDSRIVRYLSLPGEDLLDVRVMREACELAGLDLRFTGLNAVRRNSAADIQLNMAESEVRGLPRIHSSSTILRERFESIANGGSLAHDAVRRSGPFHAVNVDLCDHIARRAAGERQPTILDALAEVIQLQLRHARHPWLLFITTRVSPDGVDIRNLGALIQAVRDNVAGSAEFGENTAALLRTEADGLQAALADPTNLDPHRFMNLFTLGFGKWLLRFLGDGCSVQMLPSCFYSVQPERPDMLSLGYRCDVVQPLAVDRYRMVGGAEGDAPDAEIDYAMRLVEATGDMFDLDARLERDEQMAESVTLEAADLLRSAHYDVDGRPGYRDWLEAAV